MMDCILNIIKILSKMTCGLVSVQGWLLNTGKNNKGRQMYDCYRVAAAAQKRWPWPLNRGGCLVQVINSVCMGENSIKPP